MGRWHVIRLFGIMSFVRTTDYLIIGAGISGLSTALHLQNLGKVTVITKGEKSKPEDYWDQGGVAAVLTKEDRFKKHIEDTMDAGYRHANRDAVRFLVEHAPKTIRFLESIGVEFQKEPEAEVGHGEKRVWRTSDMTGADILGKLIKNVAKSKTIEVVGQTEAVELIVRDSRCEGVYIRLGDQVELEPILAKQTILATGGLGRLYERSDSARGMAGNGIALAVNAGLEPRDLEFVQFHPTALAIPDDERYFVLSEMLRVFGAKVVDSQGQAFLDQYDRRAELAPRDVLSRAIHFESMNGKVFLDLRYFNVKEIKKHFPNVVKRLSKYGFDVTKDLIPITPVVHFSCGGIPVNLQGETKLPGLWAVGEVACTGVNGANHLPSNALLETFVFAEALGKAMERRHPLDRDRVLDEKLSAEPPQIILEPMPQVRAYAKRIEQIMWNRVGIVRTPENLRMALKEITEIPARDYRIQHRQLVAYKLIQACLARPESLGCHHISEDIV